MKKMTIKYTDFNGVEREEDFWFNLTEAEIMDMNLSKKGGLEAVIKQIINTQDVPALAELFKSIINKSYGIKSPDGRNFVKSEKILADFVSTQAYSNLYMMLITNTDKATEFINGVVGEKITAKAQSIDVKK